MKFFITIFLIFTHYVCGGPCIVEKDTTPNIVTIETVENFYKHTTSFTVAETLQITSPASRINCNKRFVKRYRKTHRLIKAWLQNNELNAGICMCKPALHIYIHNHPFNPWLPAYLSLLAVFEV